MQIKTGHSHFVTPTTRPVGSWPTISPSMVMIYNPRRLGVESYQNSDGGCGDKVSLKLQLI
jgi:hypothetical protein